MPESESIAQSLLSAPTATERLTRVQIWLTSEPDLETLQVVVKDLTQKDKGAAKPARERLKALKTEQRQSTLAQKWSTLGQALLEKERMGIAEGLGWLRDAEKANAPFSVEPLSGLRTALQQRINAIEDVQNQVAVQKEAALLLAQRIETYSTRSWQQADSVETKLASDVQTWMDKKITLENTPEIHSLDLKYADILQQSAQQLQAVWQAFHEAVVQARIALTDAKAALPAVPIWAEEIRRTHGLAASQEHEEKKLARKTEHQEATNTILTALKKLEAELALGHSKISVDDAQQLREALKQTENLLEVRLLNRAQSAIAAAGELSDWQRWRADQIREELIRKAQSLEKQPLPPRKQQENLRSLRDSWKQTDQGGIPNHALWKIFDHACNEAYKPVQVWLTSVKETEQASYAQRKALIEALTEQTAKLETGNWRAQSKTQRSFEARWREAGHVNEKMYTELLALWNAAQQTAFAALAAAQKQSIDSRKALIAESEQLAALDPLPIAAVKALQERWRKEAQSVSLNRHQEQKLWDRFRKPIDAAFARKDERSKQLKTAQRATEQKIQSAIQALNDASVRGEAQAIHTALAALEAVNAAPSSPAEPVAAHTNENATAPQATAEDDSKEGEAKPDTTPDVASNAKPALKKIVAVRGDDRPGAKPKPGALARTPRKATTHHHSSNKPGQERKRPDNTSHPGPRLSRATFYALRDAREKAFASLRNLQRETYGQYLLQFLEAWKNRDSAQLPKLSELSKRLQASDYQYFIQAINAPPEDTQQGAKALLRLEILQNLPSPAQEQSARRMEQLQMLTQKNQNLSWQAEVSKALSSSYNEQHAQRLQAVLKRVF